MKFIICGGRDYADKALLNQVLDGVHKKCTIHAIIEGGATGADRMAREWALEKGIQVFTAIANGDEQRQHSAMLQAQWASCNPSAAHRHQSSMRRARFKPTQCL